MSLSPDGALLAVIHFSGRLSLWDVPSLKQRAAWSQDQQVAAKFSPSGVERSRRPRVCTRVCAHVCVRALDSERKRFLPNVLMIFQTVSAYMFCTVIPCECVRTPVQAYTGSVNRVSRLISTPPFFVSSFSSLSLRSLHPPPGFLSAPSAGI